MPSIRSRLSNASSNLDLTIIADDRCPSQHIAVGSTMPGSKAHTLHVDETYSFDRSVESPAADGQRKSADRMHNDRQDEKYRGMEALPAHVNLNLNLEGRFGSSSSEPPEYT